MLGGGAASDEEAAAFFRLLNIPVAVHHAINLNGHRWNLSEDLSPPGTKFEEAEEFDFKKLKKLIPVSYVLYSDNDPHVSSAFSLEFAEKLGSKTILVKNGGHLNAESGFTSFPLVLELCKELISSR